MTEVNKDLFTPNDVLDDLEPRDSTVEIIGYVDRIVGRHTTGQTVKYELFKFFVNNACGKTVQVVAWGENIAIVENLFSVNSVVHIDGATAKLPTKEQYNSGNIRCELIIQSTTELTVLGVYNETFEPSVAKTVKLEDICNETGLITVRGYIKTNFAKLETKYQNIVLGSITDGVYKLEIRLPPTDDLPFVKGELICVTGTKKQYPNGPPFLNVNSTNDIVRLGGVKMSLVNLLCGFNTPKQIT